MEFKKYRLIIFAFMISVLVNSNTFSTTFSNVQLENVKWKKVELRPDLNKDGKKDKLIVEYFEDETKVYTKFIPQVSGEKKGLTEEKIFEKSKFQQEFNNYVQKYIENYSPAIADINSTDITQNGIKEAQNKVITKEEQSVTTTAGTQEKPITEKSETKEEKSEEKTKIESNLVKGPYAYITYYYNGGSGSYNNG